MASTPARIEIPELDALRADMTALRRDFQQLATAMQEIARKIDRHERLITREDLERAASAHLVVIPDPRLPPLSSVRIDKR